MRKRSISISIISLHIDVLSSSRDGARLGEKIPLVGCRYRQIWCRIGVVLWVLLPFFLFYFPWTRILGFFNRLPKLPCAHTVSITHYIPKKRRGLGSQHWSGMRGKSPILHAVGWHMIFDGFIWPSRKCKAGFFLTHEGVKHRCTDGEEILFIGK
jgi:hypothetical protein